MNTNHADSHLRLMLSLFIRGAVLMIAITAVLLVARPVAAAGGESEPNDTFARADRIVVNKIVQGFLDDHEYEYDDVDFYWFNGKKNQTIEAFVDGSASGVEPRICLYDSAAALIACGINLMDETDGVTAKLPERGKYFLMVESTGCGEGGIGCVGEYLLRLLATTPESESNDSFLRADRVGLPGAIAGAIGDHGTVAFFDDEDYFHFNGKAGENITIRVHTYSVTNLDPLACLYNSKKQALECQYEYGDVVIDYTLPTTGKYYLRIFAGCGEGGIYCEGDYLLWLTNQ